MSFRAVVPAVLAALALLPAVASAAPTREVTASPGAAETWTSAEGTGVVLTSTLSSRLPACSPGFSCDVTLVETTEYGDIQVDVTGTNKLPALPAAPVTDGYDIDLHVFNSNENGAKGEELGKATSPFSTESVALADMPAGFYLVVIEWYLGTGTANGSVELLDPTTPLEPGEEPPAFEPAEDELPTVTPARTHEFAGSAPFAWDGHPGGGLSDVQPQVGCREANCDYSLFKVGELGQVTFTTTGVEPTLIDADIHVYESDENASVGDEVATATNFTPNETASLVADPGYYLMMVAYSGAGTYKGTAQWEPYEEPVDEEGGE